MSDYIIDGELRDALIGLITLLQQNSEKVYHRFSNQYTNRIITNDGKEIKLPFLKDLELDLQNLEEVIAEETYDTRAEELLYVAREMKLL